MTSSHLKINVHSYAGYQTEESPKSFWLGKHEISVEEIIDRWYAPDHRYFKLRGNDGAIYILRYDVVNDFWELTMFNKSGIDDIRLSST